MEVKKNYYAIIPATVRYDNKVPPNAKLLYGEIAALCNEKGYCWATNKYFANLYDVTQQTVSRWVKTLADAGYISIEMNYKEGSKEIVNRYIQICEYPINKNVNTPINKIVKDNNTVINNTSNNNICSNDIDDMFERLWKMYPKKRGKGSVKNAQKKRLYAIGFDQLSRAIERYMDYIKKEKIGKPYIQNGSTFFNSGYVDFLDENFEDELERKYEGVEVI